MSNVVINENPFGARLYLPCGTDDEIPDTLPEDDDTLPPTIRYGEDERKVL